MRNRTFLNRLKSKCLQTGSPICLGIDPHLVQPPPFVEKEIKDHGVQECLEKLSYILLDSAVDGNLGAVKLQSAFYELHGSEGVAALEKAFARAYELDLITILDAKRGDISSTMAAYGGMAFEGLRSDCMTITPYMGADVVRPLVPWLKQGHGVFVVWFTSNSEGAFVQEAVIGDGEGKRTMADRMLDYLERVFELESVGESWGLVLGATRIDRLDQGVDERLNGIPLLMPGLGAQGGNITPRMKKLLANSPGSLVPMSRSLIGLGDPRATSVLADLKSWDDYGTFVGERIASARQAFES